MAEGLYQTDFGSVYAKDGKAWLKSPSGVVAVDPSEVVSKLASGVFQPATRDEALNQETQTARSSLGQQALTFAEGAGAGVLDVTQAPITLPLKAGAALLGQPDPTEAISGRNTIENAVSLGGSLGEALGAPQTGEALAAQYAQGARERAQVNPATAFLGSMTGAALAGGPLGGAARGGAAASAEALGGGTLARLGTSTLFGAGEGAAYGTASANEDSYIQDRQLTSEQVLTHLGVGAFVGGLVGLGSEGIATAARRARKPAPEAIAGPAEPLPTDAAIADAAKTGPLQGEEPAPNLASTWKKLATAANEKISAVQSAATGADREALQKFSPLNPEMWAKTENHPYDLLHNRTKILDGATQEITAKVQQLADSAKSVGREVWDVPAKRELVARNLESLAPGQAAAATQASRDLVAGIRAKVREMGVPPPVDALDRLGLKNTEYLREGMRPMETFHAGYAGATPEEVQAIARGERPPMNGSKPYPPVRVHVEPDGTVFLNDGRHRLFAAEQAGAKDIRADVVYYDAEANPIREEVRNISINGVKLARRDPFLSDLDEWLSGVEKEVAKSPEDAYSAIDLVKRRLQQKVNVAGETVSRQVNPLARERMEAVVSELDKLQEQSRQFLMDQGIWGKQGLAQQETNAGLERWFRYRDFFNKNFMTPTGRNYGGLGGGPIYEADPNKIANYIYSLGKKSGSLQDKAFREFVDSTEAFTGTIGKNYAPESGEFKGLAAVRDAAAGIRSTLSVADKTVRTANQIDEIAHSERGGLSVLGGAGFGGLGFGPLGALGGAALGAIAHPGQLIRQAAALRQIAARVDLQVGKSLADFFERATKKTLPAIRAVGDTAKVAGRLPKVAAIDSLAAFRGQHANLDAAYKARAAEILRANADHSAQVRERARDSLGELPNLTPKLSAAIIATATNATNYLQAKLPTGLVSPTVFQPNRPAPIDRARAEEFGKVWAAVNSPLSALEDLKRGTLMPSQVDALQAIYPKLYEQIRTSALDMLRTLDMDGVRVPYRDKLQLDVLLNLGGAGEPTMSPDFGMRVEQLRQQAEAAHATVQPPIQPMQMKAAEMTRTTLQRLESQ